VSYKRCAGYSNSITTHLERDSPGCNVLCEADSFGGFRVLAYECSTICVLHSCFHIRVIRNEVQSRYGAASCGILCGFEAVIGDGAGPWIAIVQHVQWHKRCATLQPASLQQRSTYRKRRVCSTSTSIRFSASPYSLQRGDLSNANEPYCDVGETRHVQHKHKLKQASM
jgi:hypothetical protein